MNVLDKLLVITLMSFTIKFNLIYNYFFTENIEYKQ